MHVVADFRDCVFPSDLTRRLRAAGVDAAPVEEHAIVKGRHVSQLILGYAHLEPQEMQKGLQRLKEVLSV